MKILGLNKKMAVIFYIILITVALIQIYPFFWVVTSSFKPASDLAKPAYLLPTEIDLSHYVKALSGRLPRYFINSVVIAVCVLIGLVGIGSPAGFALSKMRFKYAEQVTSFFLFGMMIPSFACLVPMFRMYNTLGLRNTYWALIIPQVGFGLPLCIFLYKSFMSRIPDDLTEAATIDGASNWYIFKGIVFPMSKNVTMTTLTYNFIGIWNEFTYANTFMSSNEMKTLPIGLNDFVGEMGMVDWGGTFAAITISILPTLILYVFLNKQMIAGMTAGAVKS